MLKSALIKGTFILTLAGFLTRILGFFYKIFLSSVLGTENLGIYQLVFPIYSICFTLYAGGIQTAISKLVAAEKDTSLYNQKRVLWKGTILSFSIACICSVTLFFTSDFLASYIIKEPRCASGLRLLCCVFPFCSITSCINGFYYGLKKTRIPAFTQLIEQLCRILFSIFFVTSFSKKGDYFSCEFAVFSIAVGEFSSMCYNLLSLLPKKKDKTRHQAKKTGSDGIFHSLFSFALPLTSTHLVISLLHSVESILIPNMLKLSGMSTEHALSIYGILTGMSMSLLMFPGTITNSLSVLLLPSISQAQSDKNETYIQMAAANSVKYCLIIGSFCTAAFLMFGECFGEFFFQNRLCGVYLQNLALLCPLLYMNTALSSILNGMGKTTLTFWNTVIGLSTRVSLILLFIPRYGIGGYFIAMLASQCLITFLDVYYTRKQVLFSIPIINWIFYPSIILILLGLPVYHGYHYTIQITNIPSIFILGAFLFLYLLFYALVLKIKKIL